MGDMNDIDDDETGKYSSEAFQLDDGEFIVGVVTHEKQQLGLLTSLCLATSKGRRSQVYEFDASEPKGRQYQYWAETGSHIIGLKEDNGNISVPFGIEEGRQKD